MFLIIPCYQAKQVHIFMKVFFDRVEVMIMFRQMYDNVLILLVPVVQRVDNTIHRINHYPVDSALCFLNTYPLDSNLSGG